MNEERGIDGQFLVDFYRTMQRRGALLVLAAFALLLVAVVISTLVRPAPPPLDVSKVGIHLLLDDGRNAWPVDVWDEHLALADAVVADGGIAVQVIRSDDLDPARWQVFMDLAAQHTMTPVLRLATTFDFDNRRWNAPQPDSAGRYTAWGTEYAAFLNALDWPTDSKHVILLNEPNNGIEWGGAANPETYAAFVVDVVAVLREEVQGVVILNGALDLYVPNTGGEPFPDSEISSVDANTFMDRMEAAQPGIFQQFDIWNNHSYPLGAFREHPAVQAYGFDFLNGAEDTTTPPPEGIHNRGINGYEWELWKLAQFGIEDIPVMITETGWRHAESSDEASLDAGDDYPTATIAAQYLDLAMRGARSPFQAGTVTWDAWLADERVIAVAPFALNGVPWEWGHTNWLALNADGTIIDIYAPYTIISRYFE